MYLSYLCVYNTYRNSSYRNEQHSRTMVHNQRSMGEVLFPLSQPSQLTHLFTIHPFHPTLAQTNRRMAQGNQDRIPLQSLVSPVDDTLERDQNRTMGARSNAGTKVKTVLPSSSCCCHQYIKRISI